MTPRSHKFLFGPALTEIIEQARAFATDESNPKRLREHAFEMAGTIRALGEIAFRLDKQPRPTATPVRKRRSP